MNLLCLNKAVNIIYNDGGGTFQDGGPTIILKGFVVNTEILVLYLASNYNF